MERIVAAPALAFKANIDDTGFAPAMEVILKHLEEGAIVHANEPGAIPRTKPISPMWSITKIPMTV
jgi:UDP-glucose 6-dehydrogenase